MGRPRTPASLTRRYGRLVAKLGIDTALKELQHYSATELLTAGVDLRTVAGQLGHGNGTTTLRHYAAWVRSADPAAASTIGGRMPTLHPPCWPLPDSGPGRAVVHRGAGPGHRPRRQPH